MKTFLLSLFACTVASAGPITGSYPNKSGGGEYKFTQNRANVLVFHHFGVEIC